MLLINVSFSPLDKYVAFPLKTDTRDILNKSLTSHIFTLSTYNLSFLSFYVTFLPTQISTTTITSNKVILVYFKSLAEDIEYRTSPIDEERFALSFKDLPPWG